MRLEERLGYVHKGIEALMAGATLDAGGEARRPHLRRQHGRLCLRLRARRRSGAAGRSRRRARICLRALMAELERLANHFGDIGAICNDASFSLMHAHCGILRERVLRAAEACFGHRLMMDCDRAGRRRVRSRRRRHCAARRRLLAEVRRVFPRLIELYDNTASLQDRTVGTGILKPELARQFGAGGFVGRASGRAFDARRSLRLCAL